MNTSSKSTSFIQFRYCNLCKISHKHKNKKHIYSLRHQEILKNILAKFRKKVDDCRLILKNPAIMKVGWEADVNVWCYFCEESILKHSSLENCTVVCGTFIKHLALSQHVNKMNEFFWENILNKTTKLHYLIDEGDYVLFKNKVDKAVKKFCDKQDEEISKNAEKIKQTARNHQLVAQYHLLQKQRHNPQIIQIPAATRQDSLNRLEPIRSIDSTADNRKLSTDVPPPATVGRKTSSGLTVIPKVKGGRDKGNIYTGAVPPWLQPDETNIQTSTIGPSLQDYQAHLKAEKKKKLPANRVGADFSRDKTDSTWLPSFSGVWSNQRRSNTRYQFERRMRGNNSQTGIDNSQIQKELPNIQPYQRKKSATVTSASSNDIIPSSHGAINSDKLGNPDLNTHKRLGNQDLIPSHISRNFSKPVQQVVPYKKRKISETIANSNNSNTSFNVSMGHVPSVLPVQPYQKSLLSFSTDPKLFQNDLEKKKKSFQNPYNIKF